MKSGLIELSYYRRYSVKCELLLSTFFHDFKDETVIVSCADFDGLFAIADDPEFLLWALDNGFQAWAVRINGIGRWEFIPTRLDLTLAIQGIYLSAE
jgi:hypothetical protein